MPLACESRGHFSRITLESFFLVLCKIILRILEAYLTLPKPKKILFYSLFICIIKNNFVILHR